MVDWVLANGLTTTVALIALLTFAYKIIRWIVEVNATMKDFRLFVHEMRKDIKSILLRLSRPAVASESPMRLTDFGREIATKLQAPQWASEVAPGLAKQLEGRQPFEVDDFSRKYIADELLADSAWDKRIAECAYEFGLNRAGTVAVMQVVLRDEVLRVLEERESGA